MRAWSGPDRAMPFFSAFRQLILVDEDAHRGPVRVVILPGAQRPEKGDKTAEAEQQCGRNEDEQAVHLTAQRSRSELPMTISELDDIATAAISGVTRPAMASGTAKTL